MFFAGSWQSKAAYRAKHGEVGQADLATRWASLDHIIPTARGGTDHAWNLFLTCVRCNEARGDQLFSEWLAVRTDSLAVLVGPALLEIEERAKLDHASAGRTINGKPTKGKRHGKTHYPGTGEQARSGEAY